jgi:A/G-specific adenine glycosylase
MQAKPRPTQSPELLAEQLLGWYDRHRRELPWRAKKGKRADPYHVWLSEIMLQQTTVAAVAGYYRKFLERWPTVEALAAAPLDDVLAGWAGLGYYARARNLHKAAGVVARELGGKFPRTAEELRTLPGVGTYTSGAIAAIAFDQREAAVDANAERVLARIYAVEDPMPGAKPVLRKLGQALAPEKRAGDLVQALMDLGATICTPKRPACANCPWTESCEGRKKGIAETLPRKGPERVRPLKRGAAFIVRDAKDRVLVVKRPEKGLLGGMLEPPLGPWTEAFPSRAEAMLQAPFRGEWTKRAGFVKHGFTHFELEIEVYVMLERGTSERGLPARTREDFAEGAGKMPALRRDRFSSDAIWLPIDKLKDAALPTVMRKIIAHGLDEGGPLFAKRERSAVAGARHRSK